MEWKGGFAKQGEMLLETGARARRLHPVVCQGHQNQPETASFLPRPSLSPEDHGHFVHKKHLGGQSPVVDLIHFSSLFSLC